MAIGGITAANCAPLVRAGADFLAVVGAVIGLYLSFYLNIASGATIVLVLTGMFALALLLAPLRNLLRRI